MLEFICLVLLEGEKYIAGKATLTTLECSGLASTVYTGGTSLVGKVLREEEGSTLQLILTNKTNC